MLEKIADFMIDELYLILYLISLLAHWINPNFTGEQFLEITLILVFCQCHQNKLRLQKLQNTLEKGKENVN